MKNKMHFNQNVTKVRVKTINDRKFWPIYWFRVEMIRAVNNVIPLEAFELRFREKIALGVFLFSPWFDHQSYFVILKFLMWPLLKNCCIWLSRRENSLIWCRARLLIIKSHIHEHIQLNHFVNRLEFSFARESIQVSEQGMVKMDWFCWLWILCR